MRTKGISFNWIAVFMGILMILAFGFSPALGSDEIPVWGNEDSVDISATLSEKESSLSDVDPDYGVISYTCFAIHPLSFQGQTYADVQKLAAYGQNRYCTSACDLWTSVQLPTGVSIRIIELNAYDGGASNVNYIFGYLPDSASAGTIVATGASTWSSGYGFYNRYISYTVNNYNRNNTLELQLPGSSIYRLASLRFYYLRQVATGLPNPFIDIGSLNSRFQNAIKALAASGITRGCSPNQYCPFSPITRGEMAVFLAEALGLHWPY
jgi:hypothetical protein